MLPPLHQILSPPETEERRALVQRASRELDAHESALAGLERVARLAGLQSWDVWDGGAWAWGTWEEQRQEEARSVALEALERGEARYGVRGSGGRQWWWGLRLEGAVFVGLLSAGGRP